MLWVHISPFMTGDDDDDGDKNGRLHVFVEMMIKKRERLMKNDVGKSHYQV